MVDSHNTPMTLEQLAAAYQQMQTQFEIAQAQVAGLHNELSTTRNELHLTKNTLQSMQSGTIMPMIKPRKPEPFNGKGSVRSWITHLNNYIGNEHNPHALSVAVSYLQGPAHEWWLGYKETEEGSQVKTWVKLQQALIGRFEARNKTKIARDKLAKWKQIKDVSSFNEYFQKILLDIPNITTEQKIDRYSRGLKSYIWRELCTKEYASLSELMRDAERIEMAHRRLTSSTSKFGNPPKQAQTRTSEPGANGYW